MDVKLIPLEDLLPLENNSKKHDTDNTKQSILEYGYRDYIEVDTVFDPPRIVCGHDRRNALEQLKSEDKPPEGITIKDGDWLVPCIVKKSATEADAIRYSIDNNLSTIKGAKLPLEDELKLFDEELIKEQLTAVETPIVGWDSDTIDYILTKVDNEPSFNEDDFQPESQPSLDEKTPIECPSCGLDILTALKGTVIPRHATR